MLINSWGLVDGLALSRCSRGNYIHYFMATLFFIMMFITATGAVVHDQLVVKDNLDVIVETEGGSGNG